MSQFSGRGYPLGQDSSLPFSGFRFFVRFLYFSVIFQASISFVFFSLGVLFSLNSFHDHMVALYAFVFGVVTFLYNIPYRPVKNTVLLFFPKLEEDIVKHTFYFLIGIPGVGTSDSFQYQLGSILFSLVGFIGTIVSFRNQNLISSYMEPFTLPQQEP